LSVLCVADALTVAWRLVGIGVAPGGLLGGMSAAAWRERERAVIDRVLDAVLALTGALGLDPSSAPDRLLIPVAVIGLLAAAAETRPRALPSR
jgi:hypothetical protein